MEKILVGWQKGDVLRLRGEGRVGMIGGSCGRAGPTGSGDARMVQANRGAVGSKDRRTVRA
jgi:hypothetical protein